MKEHIMMSETTLTYQVFVAPIIAISSHRAYGQVVRA